MVHPLLVDGGPVRSVVISTDAPPFEWIDVGEPDRATLRRLTAEYGLPESAVQDFLDPQQLPKYEHHGSAVFLILRAHVERMPASAAGVQELTQPLAIYMAPGLLLTLHHRDHNALASLRAHYLRNGISDEDADDPASAILDDLVRTTLRTFNPPSDALLHDLGRFEESLLTRRINEAGLEQMFIRRRRASTLATLMRRTREVVVRVHGRPAAPDLDDTAELADTLEFRAHELLEYANQLIGLQIAVAAHRTNEVMRLLTLISVVFLPLTFIVGFYGMNFSLPEFGLAQGHLIAYFLIGASVVGAIAWFRRRGWLD